LLLEYFETWQYWNRVEDSASHSHRGFKSLCENAYTTGLQPVVFSVSTWRAKQQRFLDTTDFSRVVFQFQPREQNSRDS
jgi:ABC-type thiamine transport system substrate-binding protein